MGVAVPVRIASGVDIARFLRERQRGFGELGIRGGDAGRYRGGFNGHPFDGVGKLSHMHGEAESYDTSGRRMGVGEFMFSVPMHCIIILQKHRGN